MPQRPFVVKEEVGNSVTVKLLDDMECKVGLTASATPEYAHVLQEFGVRDSEVVFFLVVKNCPKIDRAFGFVFGREREQDLIVKIAKGLIGG